MTNGLLAQKGKAKPAMRRQNLPGSAGFGETPGLGGFSTGSETEDLGWNDMGEAPAPPPSSRAIGLTPFSGSPESLYVEGSHAGGADWDEADDYEADEDTLATPDASAQWRGAPAPNPVGAMQERLQEAAAVPQPVAPPEPIVIEREVPAPQPVHFMDRVSAAISRFFAAFTGKADRLLVLRLDEDDCHRLSDAAARHGCDEGDVVAAALEAYLSDQSKEQDR